jgi:hypothetical protein
MSVCWQAAIPPPCWFFCCIHNRASIALFNMSPSFVFTPFGIICPICRYKVSGIVSIKLIGRCIYRHLMERTGHNEKLTSTECDEIAKQYVNQMISTAQITCSQRTISLARRELASFLVNPSQPFPYCASHLFQCMGLGRDN